MAQQVWRHLAIVLLAFSFLAISTLAAPRMALASEAPDTTAYLTAAVASQSDDPQPETETTKKTMSLAPGASSSLSIDVATILSCDKMLTVGSYGEVTLSPKAVPGKKYKAVVSPTASNNDSTEGKSQETPQARIELTVTAIPPEVQLSGLCEGVCEVAVFWDKLPAKACSGYQIQVSTSKTFKSSKSVKASSKSYYKRVTGLRGGKRYYVRVRAYKKVGGKTVYGEWSSSSRSNKTDKRTSATVANQKYGWSAYAKIRKAGLKNGWKVSSLGHSTGYVSSPSGTVDVPLWHIECTNAKYRYSINLSGYTEQVFWADLYDANGGTVKQIHTRMALSPYESAMVSSFNKGILADLKKYSAGYKKPRPNVETICVSGGDKAVVKMLNTKKSVKWDFVFSDTLKNETHDEYVRAIKKSMKLKRLSKTSVRLTIVKSALPYENFPYGYYLRAKVGGKKYYVMIKRDGS